MVKFSACTKLSSSTCFSHTGGFNLVAMASAMEIQRGLLIPLTSRDSAPCEVCVHACMSTKVQYMRTWTE